MEVDQVPDTPCVEPCAEGRDDQPGALVHEGDLAEGGPSGERGAEGKMADRDADGGAVGFAGEVFDVSIRERGGPVGFPPATRFNEAVEFDRAGLDG